MLQVGFNRRFAPDWPAARALLDDGRLGTPRLLRSVTRDPGGFDPARVAPDTIFNETLIHDFDTLRFLNPGASAVEVYATADALVEPAWRDRGLLDTAVVVVRFDNGAVGIAEACFEAAYGYDVRGEVFGSGGMATMGDGRTHRDGVLRRGRPDRRDGAQRPGAAGRAPTSPSWPRSSTPSARGGTGRGGRRGRPGRAGDRPGRGRVGARRPPGADRGGGQVSDFRLAVCAEMVFLDLPFVERVRRIADLGFEVEIWDWTHKDIAALAGTGATFSSMTGYVTGTLADPDGAAELLRTAELSLEVAEQLDCPRLNVHGTGLDDRGLPVRPSETVSPAMWLAAARTLDRLAELGERAGRVFTLENLNTAVDHPGDPVRPGRGHPGAGRGGRPARTCG